MVRTPLHSPTNDEAGPPAFLPGNGLLAGQCYKSDALNARSASRLLSTIPNSFPDCSDDIQNHRQDKENGESGSEKELRSYQFPNKIELKKNEYGNNR